MDRTTTPPANADDEDGIDEDAIEGDGRYRTAVSVFVGLVLLAVLASTLPPTELQKGLMTVGRPVQLAAGLDQNWAMFAPDPPRSSTSVYARIDREGGDTVAYELPGGAGVDALWTYRWRRYADQVARRSGQEDERVALARWVADRDRERGGRPTRITLMSRSVENLAPGPGPDSSPEREVPFLTVAVTR